MRPGRITAPRHGPRTSSDVANRRALHERLVGAGAVGVLCGHIHARDSDARGVATWTFGAGGGRIAPRAAECTS
jgi:hypothetical protein